MAVPHSSSTRPFSLYVLRASWPNCLLAIAAKPFEELGICSLILRKVPIHTLEATNFDSQFERQSRSVPPKAGSA